MIYEQLQNAFQTYIGQIDGVPPLQTENTLYELQAFVAYSRFTLLPAEPVQETVGINGRDRHRGLVQVDLFFPKDEGTTAANQAVDALMAAFPRGTTLALTSHTVHIETVRRDSAYVYESFYAVPVLIRWRVIV
jgi:hypothetical protein